MTTQQSLKTQVLVLLGAGHANVQVIAQLKLEQSAALNVILVSPFEQVVYSGMLPGLIAGHYEADELQVSLEEILQGSRSQWIQASCVAINASERSLNLSDGQVLRYDVLSINTGSNMERDHIEARLPGASTHAVFVRPLEKLLALWPRLLRFGQDRPLNMAVIGGGAAGVEIALALQHRLPSGRVTLITGQGGVLPGYSSRVRRLAEKALSRAQITVLKFNATRLEDGLIQLDSGASLACDMPWLALGGHAPNWLRGGGLALTADGYIQVNAMQQSSSHPEVFAVGDVATRVDAPHPKSGVFAVRAGQALARNLIAALGNQKLQSHSIAPATLNLIALGKRTAIMSYGFFSWQGAWVWRWKNTIDRRWLNSLGKKSATEKTNNQ